MAQGKKTILVVGATGAQGGSVARHLLQGGEFGVRALTRSPGSEQAAALRSVGAEIVQGDLSNPASLRAALEGCWGAFGVTNFWEHFGQELEQGRHLLHAVAASGVEQFVLSTLPGVRERTGGQVQIPHFDTKGQLEAEARALGLPATFVHVAFYYENFLSWFVPREQGDGRFHLGFPQGDTPLAAVSVKDLGGVVHSVFRRGAADLGRVLGVVGDDRPVSGYAADMARVLGRDVVYSHIPREVFASFDFPGAEDLAAMFDYQRQFVPDRQTDLRESRAHYHGMQTFGTWLEGHADEFRRVVLGERPEPTPQG